LFSIRGFAGQRAAVPSSGFAATAIGDNGTVTIAAAARLAVSNGELRTSAIKRALKEDRIIETISGPTGNAWQALA